MNNKFSFLSKGISRNVVLLGLISLFTDLSSQMVFPLIPLYLTSVLGASAVYVGIIEGAAESVASFLKVYSGYWSDKIKKRKPFILFGYGLSSISKPLFAFATLWPFVLFVRILDRVGKGFRGAPRDAMVADSTEEKYLGKAFGFQRSMDGIGSVLGAILALILLPILGFKNIFLLSAIPGFLVIFSILILKEPLAKKFSQKKTQIKLKFSTLSTTLKLYILASAIFALGHFGYAFLLLKAKEIGLNDGSAISLYVLFYLVYTIISTPAGMLSDKFGRKIVLIFGFLLFSIISISLVFINTLSLLIVVFAVYGVFFALIDGNQRAFVVDLSDKELKATALGFFQTAIGIFALPGGLICGLLWDKFGSGATFIFGGLMSFLTVLLLFLIKKQLD
jgi:MFS family permease